jgi:nitrite reductase/ring-hydroxylating ferredoxin subunit
VANVAGEFHAFDDTCTHLQCSLAGSMNKCRSWYSDAIANCAPTGVGPKLRKG